MLRLHPPFESPVAHSLCWGEEWPGVLENPLPNPSSPEVNRGMGVVRALQRFGIGNPLPPLPLASRGDGEGIKFNQASSGLTLSSS